MERNAIRITCLALMAMAGVCLADTVFVTTNGVGGGGSWVAAASLANGLTVCQDGDELWIEQGTYTNDWEGTNSFVIATNNVTLYGGFTNGMAFGDRDWTNYPTILDGKDTLRVVHITSTNVALDGVVIQNGYVARFYSGAGIYRTISGHLSLANCIIRDNYLTRDGNGSGVCLELGSMTMTDCTFVDNDGQSASTLGVGFYAENANVIVNNCTFSTNTFVASTGSGAGFYVNGGTLVVSNSLFVGNKLSSAGGGAGAGGYVNLAPAQFVNCVFKDNDSTAAKIGGGLYIAAGAATTVAVENCSFNGNSALNGGAMYVASGTLVVSNSTIAYGSAVNRGGAFYVAGGTLNVENSILWTNSAASGDEIYVSTGAATLEYSCLTGIEEDDVFGVVTLSHCMTDDPLFAGPNDFHLKSVTGRWDAATGGWTNDAAQSPCIDVGDPASDFSNEPTPNGSRINIGAYANRTDASKSLPAVAPAVTNMAVVTNLTAATLRGELTAGTLSEITIFYGTNQTGLGGQSSIVVYPPQQTGTVFSATVTLLLPTQTYYYACFATNAAGTNWATVSSFVSGEEPPSGGGGIIHVDKNAEGGQTGSNWLDACLSLTAAISLVNEGTNEIWVAEGSYYEGDETVVNTNVSIYGGFTGTETNRDDRSLTNQVTFSGNDVYRVLYITGTNVVLDGLIIRDGYLGYGYTGGGICKTNGGHIAIVNCIVRDHYAVRKGKGVGAFFDSGSVTMTNCAFVGNYGSSVDSFGLGFYANNANVTVIDCTVSTNMFGSSTGSGAGFYVNGGTLAVSGSSFVGNELNLAGGGSGAGGYINSAPAQFANCVFKDNDSTVNKTGGGLYIGAGAATTVTVENCVFNDSSALNGGAMYVASGTLVVSNSTIAYGSAANAGGAFYVAGGTLNVKNSILWTNSAASGDEIYLSTGAATVEYSCLTGIEEDDVFGVVTLSSCMTNDPLLGSSSDFHLKSMTGRWDSATGVWTNDTVQSPCIDVGNPASDYSNEPAPNGGRINLGAYGNMTDASKSLPAVSPVVTNRGAVVEITAATLSGELMAGTLSGITIFYGTNQTGLATQSWVAVYPPQQTGAVFSVEVSGLLPDQLYYYACFASNAIGTNWASVSNFVSGSEPPSGGAGIIHVDKDAGGSETGNNWFDACLTLTAGISLVNEGTNEIWVAEGTYIEGAQIAINTNVDVYGGFTGTETNRADRSLTNEVMFSGNDTYRVMYITGMNVVLDGLIIQDGYATAGTEYGAGIHKINSGQLSLANCIIRDNNIIRNCKGGGAYFVSGSVTMTNCMFVDNACNHTGYGAGFYAENVNVTVNDCTLTNNTFRYDGGGGGFYLNGGTLAVSNSTFVVNQLDALGRGFGCAGYVNSAPAQFVNCVFRNNGNAANTTVGGLYIVGAATAVTVENCTFSSNSAFRGSTMYVASGTLAVRNSAIAYGSSGANGGAVYLGSGVMAVSNSTIAYSTCAGNGGAFYVAGGALTVESSILWSNSAVSGDEVYVITGAATVEYSCLTGMEEEDIFGVVALSYCMTKDPLFASSSDFHLKSMTGRWDVVAGVWTNDAVQSPCVDVGDPASDFSNEPTPNGSRINLGAYGNTANASKSLPAVAPVVTNRGAVTLYTMATLSGELTAGALSEVTVFYGTNQAGFGGQSSIAVYPPQQTGAVFSVKAMSLLPDQLYYYAYFASNAIGTNWASVSNFVSGSEPLSGGGGIIHVDKDAEGAETGGNWFDACLTLSAAIPLVNEGTNEIWVAEGTYIEGAQIAVNTNVCIYGGFTGTETNRVDRSLTNEVIFSGNDAYRVMNVTGTNVVMDGLIIQDGKLFSTWQHGAGIEKTGGGFLSLANCIMRDNEITRDCSGGGAYFDSGSVTMTDCVFADNYCNHWGWGVGLYAENADVTVNGCTFTNNTFVRSGSGAGFYLDGGTLAMSNSSLVGNELSSLSSGSGAGGYIDLAWAQFMNCVFLNNNSTIDQIGGGLYIAAGVATTVTVENCTFKDNLALSGGALYLASGVLPLKNSILWTNAATSGSEIYATGADSDVIVSYSAFAGTNSPCIDTLNSATVNLGDGILTDEPLFASATDLHLKSEAGRWTAPNTWVTDDVISPCIDAGDPHSAYSMEPLENGGRINLGAYGNTSQASKSPAGPGTLFMLR